MSASSKKGGTSTLRPVSRRAFLEGAAGAIGGAAFCAFGLSALPLQSRSAWAPRPPGALEDDRFTAACARCGQCVKACPHGTLRLASMGDPASAGTPTSPHETSPALCARICLASKPVRRERSIPRSRTLPTHAWAWQSSILNLVFPGKGCVAKSASENVRKPIARSLSSPIRANSQSMQSLCLWCTPKAAQDADFAKKDARRMFPPFESQIRQKFLVLSVRTIDWAGSRRTTQRIRAAFNPIRSHNKCANPLPMISRKFQGSSISIAKRLSDDFREENCAAPSACFVFC